MTDEFYNKGFKKSYWFLGQMLLLLFSTQVYAITTEVPTDLKCEYRVNTLGIDNISSRWSGKLSQSNHIRGQKQTVYQIIVTPSLEKLENNNGDLWNSGKTESGVSVNIAYSGKKLTSGQDCYWKVRVWDVSGSVSNWSSSAKFTIGLLNPSDWKGDWIHKVDQKKTDHNWYRKTFELIDKATSAFVYVGSFGYHELYVNGQKVTNNVLNPVSSYMKKRIPYLTYDVTDLLKEGENVIGVWHAAGWTRWDRITEYRNPPFVFKAQADIITTKEKNLSTDATWKCKISNSSMNDNK